MAGKYNSESCLAYSNPAAMDNRPTATEPSLHIIGATNERMDDDESVESAMVRLLWTCPRCGGGWAERDAMQFNHEKCKIARCVLVVTKRKGSTVGVRACTNGRLQPTNHHNG